MYISTRRNTTRLFTLQYFGGLVDKYFGKNVTLKSRENLVWYNIS